MSNLLSPKRKHYLLWMRRFRIAYTFFVLSAFFAFIVSASFLPIYIYTKIISEDTVADSNGSGVVYNSSKKNLSIQRKELTNELRKIKKNLDAAYTAGSIVSALDILNEISDISNSIGGIDIRLLNIEAHLPQDVYAVRLSGVSQRRDDIVTLRDMFENSNMFSVKKFPLSNLTPKGDIYSFVIESTVPFDYNNQ